MRSRVAVAIALLVVATSAGHAEAFTWPWARADVAAEKNCNNKSSSCPDCNTLRVCVKAGNTFVWANDMACPEKTPYCNNGMCTSQPSTNCTAGIATSNFQCHGEGYFPDPVDCRRYHFCAADGKAYDYDCYPYQNTVYDQVSTKCEPRSSCPCATFSCPEKLVLRYQWHQRDNSVYGFCTSRDVSKIVIAKCPAGTRVNTTDPTNPNCAPYCARAGRFAVAGDSRRYSECAGSRSQLRGPFERTCPENYVFDTAKEQCVAKSAGGNPSSPPGPANPSNPGATTLSPTSRGASVPPPATGKPPPSS